MEVWGGGPYLCRLLPLRSSSASSIPDCLTSLTAGWRRGGGRVDVRREDKLAAATLSTSATRGARSAPARWQSQTVRCRGFGSTSCETKRKTPSLRRSCLFLKRKKKWWWGKKNLLACNLTSLFGNQTAVNQAQAERKSDESQTGEILFFKFIYLFVEGFFLVKI